MARNCSWIQRICLGFIGKLREIRPCGQLLWRDKTEPDIGSYSIRVNTGEYLENFYFEKIVNINIKLH